MVGWLTVSASADRSDESQEFPFGTERVYVIYDYSYASGDSVSIVIAGLGLSQLFRSPDRTHWGSGTDHVVVTGADIYTGLVRRMIEFLSAVRGTLDKIQSASVGIRDFVDSVNWQLEYLSTALDPVESLAADGALTEAQIMHVGELRLATDEMSALAEQALRLPGNDQRGIKALTAQMDPFLQTALEHAEALVDASLPASGVMLPASEPRTSYNVQGWLNGQKICMSTDFHIER
jgi:hypothetical protein